MWSKVMSMIGVRMRVIVGQSFIFHLSNGLVIIPDQKNNNNRVILRSYQTQIKVLLGLRTRKS